MSPTAGLELAMREIEEARDKLGASPGVSLGQAVDRVMAELKEYRTAFAGVVDAAARDSAASSREARSARAEADAAREDLEAMKNKLHVAQLDQGRFRAMRTMLTAALGIPQEQRDSWTWDSAIAKVVRCRDYCKDQDDRITELTTQLANQRQELANACGASISEEFKTLLGRVQGLAGDLKAYENRIDRLAEILGVPPISVVERVGALAGQISVADARVSAVEHQLNAERDAAADQADDLTQRELECAALVAAIRRDEDEIQRLRAELAAARRPPA